MNTLLVNTASRMNACLSNTMSILGSVFIFLVFSGFFHIDHCSENVLMASCRNRIDYMLNITAIKALRCSSDARCLMICRNTVNCRSFNYGNGTCFILNDFLCSKGAKHNLTLAYGMRYCDLHETSEEEVDIILSSSECKLNGRCDRRCACMTKDTGQKCIFPFALISTQKAYFDCTRDSPTFSMQHEEELWCSTKVNEYGYHVDGYSGVCADWC